MIKLQNQILMTKMTNEKICTAHMDNVVHSTSEFGRTVNFIVLFP
jgi:hypothetical protein